MYHQIMLEEELLSPVHEQLISDSIFTRRSPCKKRPIFSRLPGFGGEHKVMEWMIHNDCDISETSKCF